MPLLALLKDRSYSFFVLVILAVLSPLGYFATLNWLGPSTDYFNQSVASATKGDDGRNYIHVGDQFLVHAEVIRHSVNGSCQLSVYRVRQNIGGRYDGRISLLQFIDQVFVGDGKYRHTSWPIPPTQIGVDNNWFDDQSASEQTMDVFVIGRYYCNALDYIFPRWLRNLDGDLPDGKRILSGFDIPHWVESEHQESEHTRVVLTR